MKPRLGISLVELLLTLSACSVILTLSAGLIHRVMHTHSKARTFLDVERAAWRLTAQFRRDVHEATEAEVLSAPAEGVLFRLRLRSQRVVDFRHEGTAIVRVVSNGESVQTREVFDFTQRIQVTFEQPAPGIVALSVTSESPESAASDEPAPSLAYVVPVALHVEARTKHDAWTRIEEAP